MSRLERTQTGVFTLKDAVDIEEIKNMGSEQLRDMLFSADYPLVRFGRVELSQMQAKNFVNGKKLRSKDIDLCRESLQEDFYNVYYKDIFLGVAKIRNGIMTAHKVFDVRMQNVSI